MQHKFNEIYGWNWNDFLMTTYYIFLKVIIFVWKNVGWCISIQRRRIPAKMQFQRCFDWKYIKKCTIIKIYKYFIQNLWTKKNIYGLSLKYRDDLWSGKKISNLERTQSYKIGKKVTFLEVGTIYVHFCKKAKSYVCILKNSIWKNIVNTWNSKKKR